MLTRSPRAFLQPAEEIGEAEELWRQWKRRAALDILLKMRERGSLPRQDLKSTSPRCAGVRRSQMRQRAAERYREQLLARIQGWTPAPGLEDERLVKKSFILPTAVIYPGTHARLKVTSSNSMTAA